MKIYFYVNLFTLLFMAIVMASGVTLQWEYHLRRMPDDALIFGLDRWGWSLVHKISALFTLAGITAHCLRHRKNIAAAFKRSMRRKMRQSQVLFILCLPLSMTAITAWLLSLHAGAARIVLVEIHDKLALIFVPLVIFHVVSRAGGMIRMFQTMARPAAPCVKRVV